MNNRDYDVLLAIKTLGTTNQRQLSRACGISLGSANASLKQLSKLNYISQAGALTKKAMQELENRKPKRAIILAAGYGLRMVPLNAQLPKGLIEIDNQTLIERLINQLHEVGIRDILIVVGFMKEQYEFLIDKYDVKLIVNSDFSSKNNLWSLSLTSEYLECTYIIPCDVWCKNNPFSIYEPYSWYMLSSERTPESGFFINRKHNLSFSGTAKNEYKPIGLCYLGLADSLLIKDYLQSMSSDSKHDQDFWEAVLQHSDITIAAKIVPEDNITEINTYEQLREAAPSSKQLETAPIQTICDVFHASQEDIINIYTLKKGMTNRSFLFTLNEEKYIMRIPGEGTDQLISRNNEYETYQAIKNYHISDDVVYLNPKNGYKITRYIENSYACNPNDWEQVRQCMTLLHNFHDLNLHVAHKFDVFEQINFYEALWNNRSSLYRDYEETKKRVFVLRHYINKHVDRYTLCHIDSVPDNFLRTGNEKDTHIRLIDWEYAAMQDPHIDIAMFAIYAGYTKQEIDRLIDIYTNNLCPNEVRIKIYCYISACGLLWSNWCEYKRDLGITFGEYSLRQYRYAKEYAKIAIKLIESGEIHE